MDRVPISSRSIASAGYDSNSQTLEIEFTSNVVYQYFGVPEQTFEEFLNSGSKGQFFHQYIRNIFPTSKIG